MDAVEHAVTGSSSGVGGQGLAQSPRHTHDVGRPDLRTDVRTGWGGRHGWGTGDSARENGAGAIMASLAGTRSQTDAIVALSRLDGSNRAADGSDPARSRARFPVERRLPTGVQSILAAAHARAARIAAGGGHNEASDAIAAHVYAADVVARLAAEGDLDPTDTQVTVGALAETCSIPLAAAAFDLFLRATSSPALLRAAAGRRGRDPAPASAPSRRRDGGLALAAHERRRRRVRPLARRRSRRQAGARRRQGRDHRPLPASGSAAARPAHRHGSTASASSMAAVVARVHGDPGRDIGAYLDAAAAGARAGARARAAARAQRDPRAEHLTASAENRLTRLGFDLHDGPIQDVLALGAETRRLRDEVYPFVLESHRELVRGRFDDLIARLVELDRAAARDRALARVEEHRLAARWPRSSTARSRRSPRRTAIEVVRRRSRRPRDAQLLTAHRDLPRRPGGALERPRAQRRDHRRGPAPGPPRRPSNVSVTDNGHGFEVNRSLALAAERGRLGLVGIGERDADARRLVRDREPARRADDAPVLAAPLGAVPERLRREELICGASIEARRESRQRRDGAPVDELESP